jgi:hypothetical protein
LLQTVLLSTTNALSKYNNIERTASAWHAGDVLPYGERPSVCCQECQAAEACNLWRWCSRPAGCGQPGDCTKYTTAPRYGTLLPHQRFGPFNSNACTPDGRWPRGMCSLMMVQSAANATYKSRGNSSGFVSGMVAAKLHAHAGCPVGMSTAACAMCLATKNPASCFTLLKRTYQFQPDIPIPAKLAAVCANMPTSTLVNTCMWCRTSDTDCLFNILMQLAWQDDPAAAEAAVKCVQLFRTGHVSSMAVCSTCTAIKDAKLHAACFKCYNTTQRAGSSRQDGCSRCFSGLSSDAYGCSSCVASASLKHANNSNHGDPAVQMYSADDVNRGCIQCSPVAVEGSTATAGSTTAAGSAYFTLHTPPNKEWEPH